MQTSPTPLPRPARGGVRGPVRVCLVQSYRAPEYIRGRSLAAALAAAEEIDLSFAVNRSHGLARYWETIRALLRARRESDPQVYLLVFRGHEIAWLVRWLTGGKPLVFDAMMSPFSAFADESKHGRLGRWMAPFLRRFERRVLHGADVVLTDTAAHALYYQSEFDIPEAKLLPVPVGAVEQPGPLPVRPSTDEPLRVLFYGSFLPLHGVDVILEAAARLKDLPIAFHFIGGSPAQAARLIERCASLGVRRYTYRRWVAFEQLLEHEIPATDLCLGGPFGGTPQAYRVVTGKTQQSLALGKVTVVGNIPEEQGFVDKINCLLVEQDDPEALAQALRWANDNRDALPGIGQAGQDLYARRFSTRAIAEQLVPSLVRLASGGPRQASR
jgi:glycosyltransferase involved in cell wall biosynthesis